MHVTVATTINWKLHLGQLGGLPCASALLCQWPGWLGSRQAIRGGRIDSYAMEVHVVDVAARGERRAPSECRETSPL